MPAFEVVATRITARRLLRRHLEAELARDSARAARSCCSKSAASRPSRSWSKKQDPRPPSDSTRARPRRSRKRRGRPRCSSASQTVEAGRAAARSTRSPSNSAAWCPAGAHRRLPDVLPRVQSIWQSNGCHSDASMAEHLIKRSAPATSSDARTNCCEAWSDSCPEGGSGESEDLPDGPQPVRRARSARRSGGWCAR